MHHQITRRRYGGGGGVIHGDLTCAVHCHASCTHGRYDHRVGVPGRTIPFIHPSIIDPCIVLLRLSIIGFILSSLFSFLWGIFLGDLYL
jgi:hypothetical protein